MKIQVAWAFFLLAAAGGTCAAPVSIVLAHGSEGEHQTKAQLERLISRYDLSPWIFSDRVAIDERSTPHSHPVVTLHTRHRNDDELLLSTFVHEQLHWYVTRHHAQAVAAVAELKRAYADIPVGFPVGSEDEEGNYYHLIVIWLEYRADRALLGELRARQVMEFWREDHYTWLYSLVLKDQRAIGDILRRESLIAELPPQVAARARGGAHGPRAAMSGLGSFDSSSLVGFVREWERLFDSRDYETIGAYYCQDAQLIAAQTRTQQGRQAIERFWRQACAGAEAVGLTRTVGIEDAGSSGALGYLRGNVVLTPRGRSPVFVRYLTLWVLEADDRWRIRTDISSIQP